MTKKSASRKRTLILFLFALIITAAVFWVVFQSILFQEGNPLQVIRAVSMLERSGDKLVRIPGEEIKYIQKAASEEPLSDYLVSKGWTFLERLGSSIFFEKDDETLCVETRMLTRRYLVYELDLEP